MMIALLLSVGMLFAAKPTAMDMVRAYAAAHHHALTEREDHGHIWIELKDSDVFGQGRTEEEAAEDFLSCADLMDHEPTNHTPAAFVCPEKDYCI
jgi:hypothetical protein